MSVNVNGIAVKNMFYNAYPVNVWTHNGMIVYGGSGELRRGGATVTYSANTSKRDLTSNSSWSGDIDSGIFTISENKKYKLTANFDVSEVTVTMSGSSWQVLDGAVTLKFYISLNGAWDRTIVYKYYGQSDLQRYSTQIITFKNIKKGDYISVLVETSGDKQAYIHMFLSTYTVKYKL